jgi:Protein of unknown function (DUF2971)
MGQILYKFLPAEFALKVLEESKLKVSTQSELNDIYDLSSPLEPPINETGFGVMVSSPQNSARRQSRREIERSRLKLAISQICETYGIICLTKSYQSPLLWGHYARGATGVALGFDSARLDLEWKDRVQVAYSKTRPIADIPDRLASNDYQRVVLMHMCETKAKEWEYESEVRYLVTLSDCYPSAGLYFATFCTTALKRVIVGPRCSKSVYLKHFVNKKFGPKEVEVLTAIMDETKYELRAE